jgi:hypothetical protein
MAFAFSSGQFRTGGIFDGFWSFRRFAPAILCSLVIFPATLVAYAQMQPATVRAGPVNALSIAHPSWGRSGVLQDIDVRIERSKGRPVKLYLDSIFGQNYALERTLPLPKTISTEGDGQVFLFDAPADTDLTVTLTLRPLTLGRSDVQLRTDVPGIMMASSTLSEFILP